MALRKKSGITVQITCNVPGFKVEFARFKRLVRHICLRFGLDNAVISIAIVDDDTIGRVNEEFLREKTETDVISFDLSDESEQSKTYELVLNADRASRQARQRGHSAEAEIALYITHGLLHNLGFDDTSSEQAKKMHRMEDEILLQNGFGVVYTDND